MCSRFSQNEAIELKEIVDYLLSQLGASGADGLDEEGFGGIATQ